MDRFEEVDAIPAKFESKAAIKLRVKKEKTIEKIL
jgi:hypothetical protein